MKLKKLIKSWRIILLVLFLLFAYISIDPKLSVEGVAIKYVELNSSASIAGMKTPLENIPETKLELIKSINSKTISDVKEYSNIVSGIEEGEKVKIITNKGTYNFLKKEDIGISVKKAATSNIKKGLELAGGTRAVLKPEEGTTDEEIRDLISSMENRLNVYGLSDIKIKPAGDFLGNKYIVVEISGATKDEVKELIAKQGKFEAKIGNDTVFVGGKEDITFVCRNDGTCSGVRDCYEVEEGYYCKFQFAIGLSESAAQRQADITSTIPLQVRDDGEQVLEKQLDLYLDGTLVDSLNIIGDLKGKAVKDIAISGPGIGLTRDDALNEALKQMNHLQTILITGSLKTKIEIVKMDSISPALGEEFVKNTLLVGLLSLLAVSIIIFIRYRKLKISLAMVFTCVSELILMLGVVAFLKYNLDLAAIAGLIAAIGTGVDDQIVIADEVSKKESYFNWKDRTKRAFFIIFSAFATNLVAMLPLLKAGAGLLTGFALMTIVGISIGVFITRPAFAVIIENLLEE